MVRSNAFNDKMEVGKEYKYKSIMEKLNILETCPCKNSTEKQIKAYRFVHEEIENSLNFLPVILHDEIKGIPARVNSESDLHRKCSACGLSMFSSLEAAIAKLKSLPSRSLQLMGYTHMAEGNLTELEGKVGPENDKGHFDFFEYHDINLVDKFLIVANFEKWKN